MSAKTYRFATGRLLRNLTGLLPLVGFPVVLHLAGHRDYVLYGLFGILAAVLCGWVLFSAARFKLVVGEDGLSARGRFHHHRVPYAEMEEVLVRRGRDKGEHFMGPPPYRELVIRTRQGRTVVISSLPLGEEAFEEVARTLATRLPDEVFPG